MPRKKGGNLVNLSKLDVFNNYINICNLLDLGFRGPMFTWTNNRFKNKKQFIFERLDKFLSNAEWLDFFPHAQVFHLARCYSDHCLLVLHASPFNSPPKTFKLETMLLDHPRFPYVLTKTWLPSHDYNSYFESF